MQYNNLRNQHANKRGLYDEQKVFKNKHHIDCGNRNYFADLCRVICGSDDQISLTPGGDEACVSHIIDVLSGGDGLYKKGLNGFYIYNYLGYIYMGWRTSGGSWQNRIINDLIMKELEDNECYLVDHEADSDAPYGEKSPNDMSDGSNSSPNNAWVSRYQGIDNHDLGYVWDPEYASLEIKYEKADGTKVDDDEAETLAEKIGGKYWSYNPETEVYQKNFAQTFGMDYDNDIKSLGSTSEKIEAMHDKLMSSEKSRDERTGVDDYDYIKRPGGIGQPNLEALLNQRTKLAWNSCFTDPAGTDPGEAAGSTGEFVYIGKINTDFVDFSNTEGIDNADLKGKILLTDSSIYLGLYYAGTVDAVGVASKSDVESFLCPKDDSGKISNPWYDSSRYARGNDAETALNFMEHGNRVVEWQFSNQQYDSMKKLLKKANDYNEGKADADKVHVNAKQIAIGQIYPMTKTDGKPGVGQSMAVAEWRGSDFPEKRVLICAHLQEPGCNDNATGVAALLGMARQLPQLIHGTEPLPCTITFLWGDELNMVDCWMASHPEEAKNVICAIDMDMTGEDPDKTGGEMRIEKTPDPSATYGYDRDAVPWNEPDKSIPSLSNPYYDENYKSDNGFVRLPDSHTLWGAEPVSDQTFKDGFFLNDLYMYVAGTVRSRHDKDFRVKVCPYEGGSDHSVFLKSGIPALLTWHFTDYTYHTSSDTLYMASPRELESVGITTLATAVMTSSFVGKHFDDSYIDIAKEILGAVKEAGLKRMDAESVNTDHRLKYAAAGHETKDAAIANEKEVLQAWGDWYEQALDSVANTMYEDYRDKLSQETASAKAEMAAKVTDSLNYADRILQCVDGHNWNEKYTVDKEATCTEAGSESIHCSKCDSIKPGSARDIEKKGHSWGGASYSWTKDNSSVTATRVCKRDASHKESETVKTTAKVAKAATYTTKGETTYTAIFKNGAFKTQTKTLANIPILQKKKQPMTVSAKAKTVKVKNLKKKARTVAPITVSNAKGKVTYRIVKGNSKSKKALSINQSTGKIKVAKKTKKGKYRVTVKVTAAGTAQYLSGYKTVVVKVTVEK